MPLWDALRSEFFDWRYTMPDVGNDTITMDYVDHHNNETDHRNMFAFEVGGLGF